MKMWKIAQEDPIKEDLKQLYQELHQQMLNDFKTMKSKPRIPEGQLLLDIGVYGPGLMYSGRVGAMEDALDAILKLLRKYA